MIIWCVGYGMLLRFLPINFLRNNLKIIEIDFAAPWWKPIMGEIFFLSIALGTRIINAISRPLIVFCTGMVFSTGRFEYLFYLFLVRVGIYVLGLIGKISNSILQLKIVHSIHFRAHQRIIQVDPVFHSNRSSGTILGKIDRGARAFEEITDAIYIDIVMLLFGIITVTISFIPYSATLAFVTLLQLLGIIALNIYFSRNLVIPLEKNFIRADDKVKNLCVENLAQLSLIRTCFATTEINDSLMDADFRLMNKEGSLWFTYNFFYFMIKILYLISVFFVGFSLFLMMRTGILNPVTGLSLIMMYMRGTYDITRIERPLRTVFKTTVRISDLFSFINDFGKQSFPVLQTHPDPLDEPVVVEKNNITIQAAKVSFDYSPDAEIFHDHNFNLSVSTSQELKLYGIIGPSGIGKSTLMLLLGGQLNPSAGNVLVNDIDVYRIDDIIRRKIIAVQGQIASSMRGTLRHNLLFGMPKEQLHFNNQELEDILKKVGLWDIFNEKKGLDTFIGEGGLNLSGGQRQRLNFANLYLRATFYHPLLILIDEPTSSLDEISERAITDMIRKLAHSSVTLVIAHRLKTINDAVGVLDLSLLPDEKELVFYTHQELRIKSAFYKRLVSGDISLED